MTESTHRAKTAQTEWLTLQLATLATVIALLICYTEQNGMRFTKHGKILYLASKIKSPHTEKEWLRNRKERSCEMGKRGRPKGTYTVFYTVYDNRTDELVCLDATAEQAAKAMGMKKSSFAPQVRRCETGECKKWTIIKRKGNEDAD